MVKQFGDIENSIPIPPRKRGRPIGEWAKKLTAMKIGQSRLSFATPTQTRQDVQITAHTAATQIRKRGQPMRIETRSIYDNEDGECIRIWRRE